MNNYNYIHVFKHAAYGVLLLVLYVLQSTPGLFEVGGLRPMWVIPAAIAIAMYEGEFAGGIYGAAAGLLCDVSSVALFGYNGFMICLFSTAAGLLVIYLLRCNLMGCCLMTLITQLVRSSIEFLFAYGMWGYENVWKLYAFYALPSILYTTGVTPLVYWTVRAIRRKADKAMEH